MHMAHGPKRRGTFCNPSCMNYAVFDPFSSILSPCDALELQMNFIHFACLQMSSKNHRASIL